MLPPEPVVVAARRWLRLLRTSSLEQAFALIQSTSAYTDLSVTQYGSALDWLRQLGLADETARGRARSAALGRLRDDDVAQLIFSRALEADGPPWLPDADLLVVVPGDLPADATALAAALGIGDLTALRVVRQAHSRVDLEKRSAVGLAGEHALVKVLESQWPGSCVHVALESDALGYDISFQAPSQVFHLEVKTTTRHGRLVVYLSRHEAEISLVDPLWRLVIVGLDPRQVEAAAIATVATEVLTDRRPQDVHGRATWDSVRLEFVPADLRAGLSFVPPLEGGSSVASRLLAGGTAELPNRYAWLPTA